MTSLADFLLQCIADDEAAARDAGADAMVGARWKHYPEDAYNEIQSLVIAHSRQRLAECEALRAVVEWHQNWPVLVETQPDFDFSVQDGTIEATTLRMSKQIAWLTEREYRAKFGTEPPTSPILRALATPYADRPGFEETWR